MEGCSSFTRESYKEKSEYQINKLIFIWKLWRKSVTLCQYSRHMKTEDLIEEIERNRRLSELEETPRTAHDYCSAMPDKEMINRYIEYLINQSESKDLQIRSLEIKIDELADKFGESSSKINEFLEELKLLRKELSESQKESRSYRK